MDEPVDEDDILFAEADKWLRQVDDSDYIPTPQALTYSPDGQSRKIADLLADAQNDYREHRRRYRVLATNLPYWRKRSEEINKDVDTHDEATEKKLHPTDDGGSSINVEDLKTYLDDDSLALGYVKEFVDRKLSDTNNSLITEKMQKRASALTLLHLVEKAKMSGSVKDEGLTRQLTKCENDFRQLSEDYKALLAKNKQLQDYKDHVSSPNQPANRPPDSSP